jgi:hypothetical protein
LTVASLDISSARLVPAAGSSGFLCRSRGSVVWVPDAGAAEVLQQVVSAAGPAELLGGMAARLTDPAAPVFPPFAIVAGRGADVVVVVHGPVEVTVAQGGQELRLYGGDEVGSWLNRLVRGCTGVSGGKAAAEEGPEDLRDGVVRADGFLLTSRGPSWGAAAPVQAEHSERGTSSPGPVLEAGGREEHGLLDGDDLAPDDLPSPVVAVLTEAESPTVVEQTGADPDLTLAEQPAATGGGGGSMGRLTWDNGEVNPLAGAVLIGRDVANDPGVLGGELVPLVPTGQNDSMSRVHAELRPQGGTLVVTDRGSTNGTFVWDEGSRAWQRLMPEEPHSVPAGGVLAFGERTATFEAVAAHVG